jgi:hypothetical protein
MFEGSLIYLFFILSKTIVILCACSAYRTALCKAKRGGFKDTHPDDILAPVLKVFLLLISNYFLL